MKVLQIGLGSMGKRRVRNMHALGMKDIIGFDFREDRRREAFEKQGIKTTSVLNDELLKEREVFIISTPPDRHNEYMKLALKYRKPAFVEASVIRDGLLAIDREAKRKKVMIIPSCTFRFHPMVKILKNLIVSKKYGKICNFSYHLGQYLPDWHPWESIKDFYVSKRTTSAAREMVPFELTWLLDLMGMPTEIFAFKGKTHDMGVDIDDTYAISLKFKGFYGTMVIDTVARFATKTFILNLEMAQIRWNWEDKMIKVYEAKTRQWKIFKQPEGQAAKGYNPNIVEGTYIEEMATFFAAIKGQKKYPNNLEEDAKILGILETCEKSGQGKKISA